MTRAPCVLHFFPFWKEGRGGSRAARGLRVGAVGTWAHQTLALFIIISRFLFITDHPFSGMMAMATCVRACQCQWLPRGLLSVQFDLKSSARGMAWHGMAGRSGPGGAAAAVLLRREEG
jgi:hypothetical protein